MVTNLDENGLGYAKCCFHWVMVNNEGTQILFRMSGVGKGHSLHPRAGPVRIGWLNIGVSATIHHDNLSITPQLINSDLRQVQPFSICGSNNHK